MGHDPVVNPGGFEVHWILAHQQESRKFLNLGSYEFSTNKERLKKKHKQVNQSQVSASRRGCSSDGAVGQASWERRSFEPLVHSAGLDESEALLLLGKAG